MTTPRPPQPEVMKIIQKRRKRLGLSLRRAAALASLSEGRWRQLEKGSRDIRGILVPENAPDRTLARMAYAVRATAAELRDAGRPEAAAMLEDIAAGHRARDAADAEDASRAVAQVRRSLTARQRGALEAEVAEAIRRITTDNDD